MTVPVQTAYSGPYVPDAVTTTFAYTFRVDVVADLDVYQGDTLVASTLYTVTGAGVEGGGTVVFAVAPGVGSGDIMLFRGVPYSQTAQYVAGGVFPAASHESALDRVSMLMHQVLEELERRISLKKTTTAALRGLVYPDPVALKLLGWNATASALTHYDAAIVTAAPVATSQLAYLQGAVAVSPTGGEVQLTASAFLPAGSVVWGVVGYVSVALGGSQGLTTWSLGYEGNDAAYGAGHAAALATATNVGQFQPPQLLAQDSARDILITADAGLFDATGTIILTYSGFTISPATSV